MVRERKIRIKDIEKLHELIDSASLPKQKTVTSHDNEELESLRKRLSDNSFKDHRQVGSSDSLHETSGNLKPRVVIHKQEDIQKKEEKVIQIDLGPQKIKKEKEHAIADFLPVKEDPFVRESLFEIERVTVPKKVFAKVKTKPLPEKSEGKKEPLSAITLRKKKEEHLPEFQPVSQKTIFPEISDRTKEKLVKEFSQKSESINEEQTEFPLFSQEEENEIPSFEPVEFQTVTTEKKEPMLFEEQKKETENRKQRKIEEKKARREIKEKKRETKRLAKEHDRKLKLEWIEFQHKQRQNQKMKELEKKKAAVEAKEKEQEEHQLLKEREEKSRLELIERQKKGKEKKIPIVTSFDKKKTGKDQTLAVAGVKPEKIRKKMLGTQKEEQTNISLGGSYSEVTQKELDSHPSVVIKEAPTIETQQMILKEKKREQKRLEREQKEKARQERLELKKKEKEQKIQKKLEEKQHKNLFGSNKENKEKWKKKKLEEKLLKRKAKEKERQAKRLLKEEQKKKDQTLVLKEIELKEKEKKEQKLKQFDEKKDREHISRLSFRKAKDTGMIDEHKKAEQQKQTMDLVRIAAEEKELRKTKAFERKMQREQRKKEKEEQKYKMKEDIKAKKKIDLHIQEEIIKEKLTNQKTERNDPFIAFDSIDQETAIILGNFGYSSIEKLRQASVKDLMKTGLKKKISQRIIAECEEFVEWQVFDTTERF